MRKTPAVQVGPNHRRGISTTLTFLDEALCEFEQWAKGREMRSVLYKERNMLSPQQRRALLAEIGRVRRLLRDLQDSLGLAASTQDAAQAVWGRCSALREHIVELEARHLRRYGKVSPDLAAFLDPRVEQLLDRLDRMSAIVNPPPALPDHD
jgi:hypothetical protein